MFQLEGECYNYINKGQILYNQEYLDYTSYGHFYLFPYHIFITREYQISFTYLIDYVFSIYIYKKKKHTQQQQHMLYQKKHNFSSLSTISYNLTYKFTYTQIILIQLIIKITLRVCMNFSVRLDKNGITWQRKVNFDDLKNHLTHKV